MLASLGGGPVGMFPFRARQWRVPLIVLAMVLAALALDRWLGVGNAVITVHVGGVPLEVEVADKPITRSRGLQHRKTLGAGAGMLFVYPEAGILRFWMKDTHIDLDIGFFDDAGRLIEVREMAARDDRYHHVSSKPAKYALEVNRGWFAANGLSVGAVLRMSPVGAK